MKQKYLKVAREYCRMLEPGQPQQSSYTPSVPTGPLDPDFRSEICELCEISSAESSPSFSSLPHHRLFDVLSLVGWEGAADEGVDAVVRGATSVKQEIEQLQAWLATVDWSQGLRCGISWLQCRACRGVPCRGSTEWGHDPACSS